ncbi:winged helix-turn-helix transcriptional regulator [Halosimplex sp. TS25]|uniref:winged helix-turn-helix transcriptional regulator n=1 Tax=Halosimplex rarum TaxID=3396619 RepID=UPI0039EAA745
MGSEHVREVLGRKRTVEILDYLDGAEYRNYSEIKDAVDTSSITILDSLELLAAYGLVERTEKSKKDVRYELTDAGKEFLQAVRTIESLLEASVDSD